jgi:hypothetical protein
LWSEDEKSSFALALAFDDFHVRRWQQVLTPLANVISESESIALPFLAVVAVE